MMERVAEPELMDDEAQARAYAEADFTAPHDHFVALLRECFPHLAPQGVALDLGCGPGDVTLRVARALPGWSIDGIDGSLAMLRHGQDAVSRAGLADRVDLRQAYLPDGRAPRPRYDLVFSNSLLHHLADPMALWRCVIRWASAGAAVFVMDLMRPINREAARHLVAAYGANEPEVLRRDFFNSLLAAYTLGEVTQQVKAAGMGQLAVRPVSDRHLVVSGERSSQL